MNFHYVIVICSEPSAFLFSENESKLYASSQLTFWSSFAFCLFSFFLFSFSFSVADTLKPN